MSRRLRMLTDDRGVAMIVVIGVTLVLFILTSMLVYAVTQGTRLQTIQETRVREVHLADAGINAYLYELRKDFRYYEDVGHRTLGPTVQDNGVWYVTVDPPTSSTPLTLRSEGRLNSQTASKTVVATVRFPSFADYMFLCNSDIRVGADAKIVGRVRANGTLYNQGWITGTSEAGGSIVDYSSAKWGPDALTGTAAGAWKLPNQPKVDFAKITADLDDIRTEAAGNSPSTVFPSTGTAGGYIITLNGTQFTIEKVTSVSTTGVYSGRTMYGTNPYTIPANGLIYFADNVWIQGKYAAACTIASSKDIYIPANITKVDPEATYPLGIIAANSITVCTQYPSISNAGTTTIQAAMLAHTGMIHGTTSGTITKPALHIRGSLAYNEQSGFANSASPPTAGFLKRLYQYDWNLENYPPPKYPQQRAGALRVNTWVEE